MEKFIALSIRIGGDIVQNDSDILVHYGVLGMKWGYRKQKKSTKKESKIREDNKKNIDKAMSDIKKTGKSDVKVKKIGKLARSFVSNRSAKKEAKRVAKQLAKNAKEEKKKDKGKRTKDLTNEELKQRIERLEMERKYNTLKASQLSEGSKIVKDILKDSSKNIGTQLATYGLGTLVNKLAKTDIVNPKKGQKDK